MLKPFAPGGSIPSKPRAISCPIQVRERHANVYVNASGLGKYSQLRIGLLDERFHPIPEYSGEHAAVVAKDGFRTPLQWKGGDSLFPSLNTVRLDVHFEGIRPEDARLHSFYIVGE
jgi:hypothetical protein